MFRSWDGDVAQCYVIVHNPTNTQKANPAEVHFPLLKFFGKPLLTVVPSIPVLLQTISISQNYVL